MVSVIKNMAFSAICNEPLLKVNTREFIARGAFATFGFLCKKICVFKNVMPAGISVSVSG